MREPLEDVGVLDSTWGGTLADMVRVVQEVRIVEDENLIELANPKGELLAQGLRDLEQRFKSLFFNVRGMGLYQGFTMRNSNLKAQLIAIARDEFNLLLLGAGASSIRTRPNLSVIESDIAHFLDLLSQSLTQLEKRI